MSKLIMIRGNSASGKTSVAKELQHRIGRNTLLIPQDMVRREMLYANDGCDSPAVSLISELVRYGHKNCDVTILEGILFSGYYKPVFDTVIETFGSDVFAYYYDIPFEETMKRHMTRDKRFEFGEAEMREWWAEKDYIGFIEEKKLGRELTLEETVEMIYSEVIG